MPSADEKPERYLEMCGDKTPHLLSPCTALKSLPVTVHLDQAINKVRFALERMGHQAGPWPNSLNKGMWMS